MIKFTEDKLIELGYKIENAVVEDVNISMGDHSCITFTLTVKSKGWGCGVYGGYCLGHGYLGAKPEFFDRSPKGLELIAQVMNIIGVSEFNDMKGKHLRVATKDWGDTVKIIGNIIEDKWFDIESFFKDSEGE